MVRRRYDMDWLRIVGILMVFAFHCALPFYQWYDWLIQDTQRSPLLGTLILALYGWPMPLFMLLAGASTWFALRRRTNLDYVKERWTRIFVPFIVATILLCPPQIYLARVYQGEFEGTFYEFLPQAFRGGGYPKGNLSWEHLWFLLYLFIYSLVALPLFRFLKSKKGARWVSSLARLCQRRGAILVLAIPLIVGQVALGWRYPQTRDLVDDWTWHWILFTVYVYGFVLFSDERFSVAMDRARPIALFLAILTSVVRVPLFTSLQGTPLQSARYLPLCVAEASVFRLGTWSWIVLLLSLARQHLSFTNPFLEYAGPTTYAFYVIHMTVVTFVVYYVVSWRVPILVRYAVIVMSSLVGTIVLVELARRWSVTRSLLGMRRARLEPGARSSSPGESHTQ